MSKPPTRHRPWLQRQSSPPRRGERSDQQPAAAETCQLYGVHTAAAALANPRRIVRRVLATEAMAARLADALSKRGIEPEIAAARDLDRRLGGESVHQGILVEADYLSEPDLETMCAPRADALPPLLMALDQVTDPHNGGALLRSAAVFGVAGVIMTRLHSPPLSGVLAKAASGALEHVPVALVTNLARALEELEDLGVYRIGLDGDAHGTLEGERMTGPTALVLGAEGRGLRRLTRERCDVLCRIATFGAMRSLNVSNAAAVALHALRTGRPQSPPQTGDSS